MSINDGHFEVYVIGHNDMDYINKNYIKNILSEHNFNLCESIDNADFILNTGKCFGTKDWIDSLEYATEHSIEVASHLDELLRLRDEYEFRGI